jgi:hypothetical protein
MDSDDAHLVDGVKQSKEKHEIFVTSKEQKNKSNKQKIVQKHSLKRPRND